MRLRTSVLLAILFFAIGLITLPDYGINWDTINHLPRGQAYLNYIVSGKKDYSGLPVVFQDWFKKNEWFYQDPTTLSIKTNLPKGQFVTRSYYQNDSLDYSYFMKYDGAGHPPLSDILSAAFNRVLYAKLHLVNDIDSYRVYGLLLAACLVGLIYYWTTSELGPISGIVATLSLASYPLFWSESHFNNEKDIPEAFYWSFFMFCFWKAITTKKLKWFILTGISAGFAFGTKFNILFSIFAVIPWTFIYLFYRSKPIKYFINYIKSFKVWIGMLSIPVLMIGIFVASWPYLWPDPISRFGSVLGFYKLLGTTDTPMPGYMTFFGFNSFPAQWILFTTPPIVIFLGVLGIISTLFNIRKGNSNFSLLVLFWFLVPILRVVWPHANTYGGIRQLMEYIPALAILCGLGFSTLLAFGKKRWGKYGVYILSIIVGLGFLINIKNLSTIHPNENVYFNSLIGGLNGAKEKNFPFWGFSFGTPYREAIVWLNDHAEPNATLVFAFELIPNFPRIWLRPDIQLINAERSGYLAAGEYAITLNYQGTDKRSYYDRYLAEFVDPVFTAQVDGVPIVSIWKNSQEHLKAPLSEKLVTSPQTKVTDEGIFISLKNSIRLWRLEVDYSQKSCTKLASGWVYISNDNINFEKMPGELPDEWRISKIGEQPKNGHYVEPFVGQEAQYIKLLIKPVDTCLKKITAVRVYSL